MTDPTPRPPLWAYPLAFVSIAGLTAAVTLVYLGMRAVMEVGGACATGGAYEVAMPCPEGVAPMIVGGILGGLVLAVLFAVSVTRLPGHYGALFRLLWPALFLSLGWNFLEFGIDPPGTGSGVDASWLACAVIFLLLAAPVLIGSLRPARLRAMLWPTVAQGAAAR